MMHNEGDKVIKNGNHKMFTSRDSTCFIHQRMKDHTTISTIHSIQTYLQVFSMTIWPISHSLLEAIRYLECRPCAMISPVPFFLNSTETTTIDFPARRTLESISISSWTRDMNYQHKKLNELSMMQDMVIVHDLGIILIHPLISSTPNDIIS